MHIGLFGGTFNPIHRCHLQIAEQVKNECGLDRIIFIPTGDPPHKDSTTLAPGTSSTSHGSNGPRISRLLYGV